MCGIAGFSSKQFKEGNTDHLHSMLESIKHRGPDGEGMESNEMCSIGMRRLAIIDPNGGWQPIYNKDSSIYIVFNGEIYNYESIWKELVELGYSFKTDHSDTETILHGYEEWGYDVVNKLIGMFSFAIYDSNKKELFIARDRLGIKPLYYHTNGAYVAFASEIKALLLDEEIRKEPEMSVLYEFLMFRLHDYREETFFKGIKRLLPAHYMVVDKNGVKEIKKYWDPKYNPNFDSTMSDDDYAHEFYGKFKTVMKRHLISDVPVGVSLSGGLDSSGVSCVMKELIDEGSDVHTNGVLHTFSAIFPGQTIDESDYIHEVENYIKSEPHYIKPNVDEFWEEIMNWMYHQEEPTISSAPYAYYSVYKEAHKHVKVMLSGNGGDELLAGYIPYFKAYATSAIDQGKYMNLMSELIKGWDLYSSFVKEKIEFSNPLNKEFKMGQLISKTFGEFSSQYSYKASRNLNERLMRDVTYSSTPNLLRYEDKNSMAFSIESRVPLLDHELVEYIFNLPIDQKIKSGWNRYVYRNALRGHMPDKNRLRRSKIGFTNPELKWLKEKSQAINSIFNSSKFRQRGIFDADAILAKFNDWLSGASGDGLVFWRILVTELWFEKFID